MGRRTRLIGTLLVIGVLGIPPAQAGPGDGDSTDAGETPATLALPRPDWYTDELHRQILAAGPRGVDVPLSMAAGSRSSEPELNCLGYSPPFVSPEGAVSLQAVSAGGCMVSPHGCTMNFVFTDGKSNYIGTAGHCAKTKGTVVMQVATRVDPTGTAEPVVTLAAVGKTVKRVDQGIGRDFALVKINPGFKVVPGVAGALGPTGVFCGDLIGQPVVHYGHGYVFAVGPGIAKEGVVLPDLSLFFESPTGFNWAGYGLPGDSGSGVMNAAGLAVGDLTHGLSVLGLPVPGLNFGTDMQGIFGIIGTGYSLVTVDGRAVKCTGGLVGS